jgi:hypothetical protein
MSYREYFFYVINFIVVIAKTELESAVTSDKEMFTLRDPCIVFPALSGLCMRYCSKGIFSIVNLVKR